MIKLIIFDLGGVVTTPEIEFLDLKIADYIGISLEELREITTPYKREIFRNEKNLHDLYKIVLQKIGSELSVKDIIDKHQEIYRKIMPDLNKEVLNIVKELRKNYTVVCLTNIEHEVEEIADKEIGIFGHFEKAYVSTRTGVNKPRKQAIQMILDDYECEPEEAVFIDDKEHYTDAYDEIYKGKLKAIVFDNVKNSMGYLKSKLKDCGVQI